MALKALFDLDREERAPTLLMSAYFFCIITVFWILKPIKKSLFLRFYAERGFDLSFGFSAGPGLVLDGPQAELFAKVLNMIVAGVATGVFVFLARRFRREKLSYVFGAVCCLALVGLSGVVDRPS